MPYRSSARREQVKTRGVSNTNVVISTANLAFLSLGRFVFTAYQRDRAAEAGMPLQNGETHSSAGDYLAEEASFILKSNDPSGFNIIDVMACLYKMAKHIRALVIIWQRKP